MRKKIVVRIFAVVLLLTIGAVLTAYGTIVVVPEGQAERQNALFTNGGRIVSSNSSENTDIFQIIFATNIVTISREDLANGIDLSQIFNVFNVSYPFQISLVNNQLSISAKIKNADGSVIADIYNNDWRRINPDLSWDRNYNTYAFEIKEDISQNSIPNVIPVLQVVMENQSTILVGCYVNSHSGQIVATINGGLLTYPSGATINKTEAPDIFKYPSKDYPGEFENPSYIRNYTVFEPYTNSMANQTENIVYPTGDPLSGPNWTILFGTILWIVGAIIMAVVGIFGTYMVWQEEKGQSAEKKGRLHPTQVNRSAQVNTYLRTGQGHSRKKKRRFGRKK